MLFDGEGDGEVRSLVLHRRVNDDGPSRQVVFLGVAQCKADAVPRRGDVDVVVHASVDLQFVVGRVASVDGQSLSVDWEQPLFIRKDNPPSVLIAQLDSKPRIMDEKDFNNGDITIQYIDMHQELLG